MLWYLLPFLILGLIYIILQIIDKKLSQSVRKLRKFAFQPIDNEFYSCSIVKVPMSDGVKLAVYHYEPKGTIKSGITILSIHGLLSTALAPNDVKLAQGLVKKGHRVISYDVREHGNSTNSFYANNKPEYYIQAMLNDSQKIMNYVKSIPEVDISKLCVIGFSYGGSIALSSMTSDPDVKLICAGCAVYDYNGLWKYHFDNSSWMWKYSLKQVFTYKQKYRDFVGVFNQISPRYNAKNFIKLDHNAEIDKKKMICLLHCKNDPLVVYDISFPKNKIAFNIKDENTLVFEDGLHGFKGHHDEVLKKLLEWIQHCFKDTYLTAIRN